MKKKVQSLNVVIAIGTTAQKLTRRITLDEQFDICTGYYMIQNTSGSQTRYSVGLQLDEMTIQDLANKQHLEASSSFKIADRFYRETPFNSKGKSVTVTIEIFGTIATTDLNFDVLFELAKKESC